MDKSVKKIRMRSGDSLWEISKLNKAAETYRKQKEVFEKKRYSENTAKVRLDWQRNTRQLGG